MEDFYFEMYDDNYLFILKGRTPEPTTNYVGWGEALKRLRASDGHIVGRWIHETITVSTVFLGMNHAFAPGAPMLFETCVVHPGISEVVQRYPTWEQAEAGHKMMVLEIKKQLALDSDDDVG